MAYHPAFAFNEPNPMQSKSLAMLLAAGCLSLAAAPAFCAKPDAGIQGRYSPCGVSQGLQFRLSRAAAGWQVAVRQSPSAAWKNEPDLVLRAASPAALAALNATASPSERATWALPWEGARFLRMPSRWIAQRPPHIHPDLVLLGAGSAILLCRL